MHKERIKRKKLIKTYMIEELKEVSLGDKRLDKRLIQIGAALGVSCEMPINQACGDAAAVKAAYRLFANEKVNPEAILEPHQIQTQKRMEMEKIVLAIQDTMSLDYTKHVNKKGFGPIGTEQQDLTGLESHNTLIVSLNGLPLGKLTQHVWARDIEDKQKSKSRRKTLINDKESYKWLSALEQTVRLTPSGVETITVCDRESDIFEFFQAAYNLNTYVLVRAAQNRCLDGDMDEDKKLWDYMDECPIAKKITIKVPKKNKTPARQATLELRYSSVDLQKPKRGSADHLPWLSLTAIWLKETTPPEGVEPIQWMLLTNLPVENEEQAIKCIEWYKLRWRIEEYHKVIKSGCRVEECRLETKERITRYFTVISIIAWRLFWMTHIKRVSGETPCNMVLTGNEWKALYCRIHKTKIIPKKIPTTYEAVRWIAQLGGFLGRKNDGEPGIVAIWRGWRRLADMVEMWSIFEDAP